MSAFGTEYLTTLTALLVLLAGLVSLVVLPSYRLIALLADHVTDNMSACCHVSLHRFTLPDIDDVREEEGLPMLTSKVTRYDFVEIGKVGLAVLQSESVDAKDRARPANLAAKDLVAVEVHVVGETHRG